MEGSHGMQEFSVSPYHEEHPRFPERPHPGFALLVALSALEERLDVRIPRMYATTQHSRKQSAICGNCAAVSECRFHDPSLPQVDP